MATIFHSTAWKNVIQKSLGHFPLYVAILRDGKITGILPLFKVVSIFTGKRLVSLPYSGIGGPLAESDEEKELLIEYAEKKRESLSCVYLELRTRDCINGRRFLADEKNYLNFRIQLNNDIDRMWSLITGFARTKVRKAEKSGLTIREGNSEEDIKTFYNLNLITRKKNGVPSFSIEFFQNIIKELKGAKLLFAELGKRTIASFLNVSFKDYVYSIYGGVDNKYTHLNPSDFLTWHTIKWASLNGFKYLDLGRTYSSDKGLISFKEKWAAQSEVLRYYYLPRSSLVTSRSGFKFNVVSTLFKKLPIPIARIIGPPLIKRLG
jgi:FemAB-related protein (PEP-CTERM system-associated)